MKFKEKLANSSLPVKYVLQLFICYCYSMLYFVHEQLVSKCHKTSRSLDTCNRQIVYDRVFLIHLQFIFSKLLV